MATYVNAELATLKEKNKTADEAQRQETNREVKRNEEEFTAAQWNDKGYELCSQKDYQGAIGYFQKSIELDGNYAAPWSNMGSAYNHLGKFHQAIDCFKKAIKFEPKFANCKLQTASKSSGIFTASIGAKL